MHAQPAHDCAAAAPGDPRRAAAAPRGLLFPVAMLLAALLAVGAGGCNNAFRDHRDSLRDLYAQGRFDAAAAVLDSEQSQKLYGKNEALLFYLDRGSVALANREPEKAIQMLEAAESMMESKFELSAGDQAAQWLLNDTARPYIGEPYESMYVNVLKLLAQLQRGNIVGGATVEARRMASKADLLRDRYLKYEEAVRKEGGAGFSRSVSQAMPGGSGGGLMTVNKAGEFIESPLGTYLTAVTFMHSDEPQNQAVAARRLLDSMRLQRGLIGPVDPANFEGLEDRPPMMGDVLVVALSGRGPTKQAQRIGPIPIFDWPVYFELPILVGGSGEVTAVRAVVESVAPSAAGEATRPPDAISRAANAVRTRPAEAYELALVEDLSAVATENHRRQLPVIYQRSILRSSLKAGASFAATQAIRANRGRRGTANDAAAIGSVIGGLALLALTERADLRSWVFLPGKAHVGLFTLPPGDYILRVEYLSARGGVVYTGPPQRISVSPGQGAAESLRTVVEHYWR